MVDRQRYWKLEAGEMGAFEYNESKMLNWDIKCVGKEDASSFVGVFAYRRGTPVGYDTVKGVALYHNHMDDDQVKGVTSMLKSKFGGKPEEHSSRILLNGSDVPYSGKALGELAAELESKTGGIATLTLEFEGLTLDEQEAAHLPATKLLPVPSGPRSEA